jgi:hypothetical protein
MAMRKWPRHRADRHFRPISPLEHAAVCGIAGNQQAINAAARRVSLLMLIDINDLAKFVLLSKKPAEGRAAQYVDNGCYFSEIENHDDTSTNVPVTKSRQAIRYAASLQIRHVLH